MFKAKVLHSVIM